jgi:hypothetical protein
MFDTGPHLQQTPFRLTGSCSSALQYPGHASGRVLAVSRMKETTVRRLEVLGFACDAGEEGRACSNFAPLRSRSLGSRSAPLRPCQVEARLVWRNLSLIRLANTSNFAGSRL